MSLNVSKEGRLTVPAGPSIVPTQSKRFASDLGNADCACQCMSVVRVLLGGSENLQFQARRTSVESFSTSPLKQTIVATLTISVISSLLSLPVHCSIAIQDS